MPRSAPALVEQRPGQTWQAIGDQILTILRGGPVELHALVLSIWPTLDEKPREVALTAIWYLRYHVDVLIRSGSIIYADGKLALGEVTHG